MLLSPVLSPIPTTFSPPHSPLLPASSLFRPFTSRDNYSNSRFESRYNSKYDSRPVSRKDSTVQSHSSNMPSPLPFSINDSIVDNKSGLRLKLTSIVGSGSYAVVYLVQDEISGQKFALKCLSKANLTPPQLALQRAEAIIHKSIPEHPNIVTLHCSFETDSWLYLVLEYCDGQDLYFWLTQNHDSRHPKTGQFLNRNDRYLLIQNVFEQMLLAVQFCHQHGVAHRDIKPENFIVVTKGPEAQKSPFGVVIKLTDFGLATTDLESDDFDCGSKPYMSYECRNNVSARYLPRESDIWSLGIVLINLLYHRSPWAEPQASTCPSFAAFQKDQIAFLLRRFEEMPRSIATFLTNKVFCRSINSRTTINKWLEWNKNFANRMMGHFEECIKCGTPLAPPSPIKFSQSVPNTSYFPVMQRQQPGNLPTSESPTRLPPTGNSFMDPSDFCSRCRAVFRESPSRADMWSNVFMEDDDEMDFSEPLVFDRPSPTLITNEMNESEDEEYEDEQNVFEMHLSPPCSPTLTATTIEPTKPTSCFSFNRW